MKSMIYLKDYEASSTLDKSVYDSLEKDIQERLYILFSEAYRQKLSIILILEGWATSGKGDLLKSILTRLDPRRVNVHSFDPNSEYNSDKYPFLRDFWVRVPIYGSAIVFDGSWYTKMTHKKINKQINRDVFKEYIRSINNVEKNLVEDKYLVFKYFLNLSAKEQKKRLKKAEKAGKKWMVSEADWFQNIRYDDFREIVEFYLNKTDTLHCPWNVYSALDKYYTRHCVIYNLIENLEKRLNVDSKELLVILKNRDMAI